MFVWKPALAGKKVKCKCGASINVPATAAAAKPAAPVSVPAAALPIEVMAFAPEPVVDAATTTATSHSSIPLAYQRGPTALEKEKALAAAAALVDPVRDLYAPIGILAVGFAIHLGYYIFRYHLGAGAIIPVGIGVVILTAIKAALLVGFAFVMAGPLGVSFGGIWSAVLKLAAIAVFTDGATAWVDFGVAKMSGGFGSGSVFGPGMIGFPIALGLYWGC